MKKHLGQTIELFPPTLAYPTPKGVKAGIYDDEVVSIVYYEKPYYIGWKCTLLKNGKLEHPAYKRPLKSNDPRLFKPKGANKLSDPTAMIKKDSHWSFKRAPL